MRDKYWRAADAVFWLRHNSESSFDDYENLESILKKGLGDRISKLELEKEKDSCVLLLSLNYIAASSHIVIGPLSKEIDARKQFQSFWGNSELRRFKSGIVLECVVFEKDEPVLTQIVSRLLSVHYQVQFTIDKIWGLDFHKYLADSGLIQEFEPLNTVFDSVAKTIRNLEELPLSIVNIYPCGSSLGYTTIESPANCGASKVYPLILEVILQVEGSSKWPSDIRAVQRLKAAFLLRLGKLLSQNNTELHARLGIENLENPFSNLAFLDISVPGSIISGLPCHLQFVMFIFRVRLFHEKEHILLKSIVASYTSSRRIQDDLVNLDFWQENSKKSVEKALASYNKYFVCQKQHCAAITSLCKSHPVLSGTIRLFKKYCAAHYLFGSHLPEQVIELIVCSVFTNTESNGSSPPGSIASGFFRIVEFVAQFDWRNNPIIVNFDSEEGQEYLQDEAEKTFQTITNNDPFRNNCSLVIVSNLDKTGVLWSKEQPSKIIAAHFTRLMQKTYKNLASFSKSFFITDLSIYDFVINMRSNKNASKISQAQELAIRDEEIDSETLEFTTKNAIEMFIDDLKNLYGEAILFFNDINNNKIYGLIKPLVRQNKNFKCLNSYIVKQSVPGSDLMVCDIDSIIRSISILGGDLIKQIQLLDH